MQPSIAPKNPSLYGRPFNETKPQNLRPITPQERERGEENRRAVIDHSRKMLEILSTDLED